MSSFKAPLVRTSVDQGKEISVQFQAISNGEIWWSSFVHGGNRLGVVSRHMGRRTRVQRRFTGWDDPARRDDDGGGIPDIHGYEGRWFCLVQAPNNVIEFHVSSGKIKAAKAVPGAYSLVQYWKSDAPLLKSVSAEEPAAKKARTGNTDSTVPNSSNESPNCVSAASGASINRSPPAPSSSAAMALGPLLESPSTSSPTASAYSSSSSSGPGAADFEAMVRHVAAKSDVSEVQEILKTFVSSLTADLYSSKNARVQEFGNQLLEMRQVVDRLQMQVASNYVQHAKLEATVDTLLIALSAPTVPNTSQVPANSTVSSPAAAMVPLMGLQGNNIVRSPHSVTLQQQATLPQAPLQAAAMHQGTMQAAATRTSGAMGVTSLGVSAMPMTNPISTAMPGLAIAPLTSQQAAMLSAMTHLPETPSMPQFQEDAVL